MTRIQVRREQPSRFTLQRAMIVALLLHVLLGVLVTRGGLLAPVEASALPEEPPLEFRFVDTPDVEPPEEPPDTATLSDQDRRAADASPIDDEQLPQLDGNTEAPLVRPDNPAVEAPPPVPPQPEVAPSDALPPRPEAAEPPETDRAETEPEPTETSDRGEANAEARETTESVQPPQPEAVETPPVRPRDLRRSLTRLESFVDPQLFDNPTGGAADRGSLAQFDTRGYDLGRYLQEVLRRIEINWRQNIPPLIQTGVGGATFVSIAIERRPQGADGEVARITIQQTWPSGQAAYDSAAHFSLEITNPLPPIPDYYPYETITGRIGFLYNLDRANVTFPEH